MDFFSEIFNELKICTIRDQEVIFDHDLSAYYQVKREYLIKAVERNIKRFPDDFMFKLTKEEFRMWKPLINIPSKKFQKCYVFTAEGAAQLSFILKSDVAVKTSIEIIRSLFRYDEFEIIQEYEDIDLSGYDGWLR